MLRRDDRIRLQHMLDAARKAVRLAGGRSREDLGNDLSSDDNPLPHALVQLIAVVGEAAGKVSSAAQVDLQEIPWADIVGMRNRLVHAYFDINLDILWDTVQEGLPPLILALEAVLKTLSDSSEP